MSFPVARTPAVWVSDLGLTWCRGCRSGLGKFIAGRPFFRVEQLKLHRSITNSWSASMISAGFRASDEFRTKIVSCQSPGIVEGSVMRLRLFAPPS